MANDAAGPGVIHSFGQEAMPFPATRIYHFRGGNWTGVHSAGVGMELLSVLDRSIFLR
jgi:hypothetical protein